MSGAAGFIRLDRNDLELMKRRDFYRILDLRLGPNRRGRHHADEKRYREGRSNCNGQHKFSREIQITGDALRDNRSDALLEIRARYTGDATKRRFNVELANI